MGTVVYITVGIVLTLVTLAYKKFMKFADIMNQFDKEQKEFIKHTDEITQKNAKTLTEMSDKLYDNYHDAYIDFEKRIKKLEEEVSKLMAK